MMSGTRGRLALLVAAGLLTSFSTGRLGAQDPQGFLRDYTQGPGMFPSLLAPYQEQELAPVTLENSRRLRDLIHDGRLELSLADALALAIENNLDVAVQRYARPLAQAEILRARAGQGLTTSDGAPGGGVSVPPSGAFDPSVSMNFSWDRVEAPLNNIVVEGTPTSVSYATAFSTRYSQLFPTGTNYTFAFGATRRSSNTRSLFNPSVFSNFSFGVNQPILSGFGRLPYSRNLLISQNNLRISEEAFRQQATDTIVDLETTYWDLAASQLNVAVAEQSLSVSQRLLEDNRRQAEIGTLAPLDVIVAEAEVAARERDLIVAQTGVQLLEARLKNMLTRRVDPELDAATIVVTDRLPQPRDPDIPDLQNALTNALNNRPDLRQQEGSLQNQNINRQYFSRSLLPSGSVFALLAGQGLRGECTQGVPEDCPGGDVSSGAMASFRQTFGLDFPEYAGGFNFSIPLRNRAAQADHLRAQLETNQTEVGLRRVQNQVALEVRQAIIGLVQGKAQVEAAHEAVRLARETLDAEQKKLQAGVSTPYQLILRERDFVAAQQAEVQTIGDYANALVEMDRSMGTTLDRNGILFTDALSGTVTRRPTPPFSIIGFPAPGEAGQP